MSARPIRSHVMFWSTLLALAVAAVLMVATPLIAQAPDTDAVQMGRFDFGKMWTFEYPPSEYFSETYGFDATPEWFERARMPALRIPGCSASFVSPNGLVGHQPSLHAGQHQPNQPGRREPPGQRLLRPMGTGGAGRSIKGCGNTSPPDRENAPCRHAPSGPD